MSIDTLSLVMILCAGISVVTVRSDTRTMDWNGTKMKVSPGPRTPSNLPRRNTTPRSYWRRMRIDPSTSRMTMTRRGKPMPMAGLHGFFPRAEAITSFGAAAIAAPALQSLARAANAGPCARGRPDGTLAASAGRGRSTRDQKIINHYVQFAHGGRSGRVFLDRFTAMTGSAAADAALVPLLQSNYAQAAI